MLVFLRKQQGFSLTEMLVVLTIIAILAITLTPAYTSYIAQYRLTAAAEALYDDINLARSHAVKQQSGVTLIFQTGSTWCYGTTVNSTCDCTSSACELAHTTNAEYTNVSLSIAGFSSSKTQFDSTRGALTTATGGSATFSASSGETIIVSINKLGVPKICSSTVGGYPTC